MGGSGTEVYSGFCCTIKSMDQRSLPGQASWPSWDLIPTQYPPGSSGISDSGDSSRNKCQDTGGNPKAAAPGWEMGVREASPSSTKSYRFLEFQLVRLAWSTPAFCTVDDCALDFVPKMPHFPTLTSCDFLTKALPQPFRRKGSLLSKEQTSNIYCCLSWEGHGPRKNLRNAREKSVFTARVLKIRPPPWSGSFGGLQRGFMVIVCV